MVEKYTDVVECNGKYIDIIQWDSPGCEEVEVEVEVEVEGGKDVYFDEMKSVGKAEFYSSVSQSTKLIGVKEDEKAIP